VVVPATIACGGCWFCMRGLPTQCEISNPGHYGPDGAVTHDKGGALFGHSEFYGGYPGGQAQYVRVPFADVGPRKVPDGITDEQALFLSDIVPAAYSGLRWAELEPGESVAVWGCGPVGLQALRLARIMGAGQVIGVDIQRYRLDAARRFADATVVDAAHVDAVEAVRALTGGRGVDVCIEAIGMEVDRSILEKVSNVLHQQAGAITAVERCFSAVRRAGRVSILGFYGTNYARFPLGQWIDKGLRVQAGQAPVHEHVDELMKLVVQRQLRAEEVITHRLPLEHAPHAYQIFNDKQDGCVKIVLDPWA
jgi:threonine dehydrogenase-like Zn-dependent dehydrogenase